MYLSEPGISKSRAYITPVYAKRVGLLLRAASTQSPKPGFFNGGLVNRGSGPGHTNQSRSMFSIVRPH